MNNYIKLTPYIPKSEGYIQDDNPYFYIRKDKICTLYKCSLDDTTRVELSNGKIHYVLESIEEIIRKEQEQ